MTTEGVRQSTVAGNGPAELEAALRREGLDPFTWSNEPNFHYEPHTHDYHSVLVCATGSIVFVVDDREVELRPGDRLDVPADVVHAATVGPDGVEVVEAIC